MVSKYTLLLVNRNMFSYFLVCSPDDAVGVSMVDDAYQILAAILANPEARNYLIEEHTVTTLCNIYAQQQYGRHTELLSTSSCRQHRGRP